MNPVHSITMLCKRPFLPLRDLLLDIVLSVKFSLSDKICVGNFHLYSVYYLLHFLNFILSFKMIQ